jgi:hypothetical protein
VNGEGHNIDGLDALDGLDGLIGTDGLDDWMVWTGWQTNREALMMISGGLFFSLTNISL